MWHVSHGRHSLPAQSVCLPQPIYLALAFPHKPPLFSAALITADNDQRWQEKGLHTSQWDRKLKMD